MKRYEFRLAAVLRLRRAEEEHARGRLASANHRLRECILERDAQSERYRTIASVSSATSLEALRSEQSTASLAAAVVTGAKRSVANAAADAALAQVAWQGSARRVEILERLDRRRRDEHAEAESRAEIATVDDIVTARYVAEQSGTLSDEPARGGR
ncbi:MAG TPA: flagellar FliJ family protein [Acidimicrobiales bacterium]|nr:flagellar FliJ family protein [Acidimicrobiales bacterium]HVC24638.1 flagellar FliJ family protein [Acidimicrobiales bacterium]